MAPQRTGDGRDHRDGKAERRQLASRPRGLIDEIRTIDEERDWFALEGQVVFGTGLHLHHSYSVN